MAHLIDKSALVAEIEKLNPPFYPTLAEKMSYQDATKDCIDIIYTLKVKEMDLEKEMQAFALLYLEPLKISDSNIGISITMTQLYSCAKHFFELGLKA